MEKKRHQQSAPQWQPCKNDERQLAARAEAGSRSTCNIAARQIVNRDQRHAAKKKAKCHRIEQQLPGGAQPMNFAHRVHEHVVVAEGRFDSQEPRGAAQNVG